MQLLQHSISRRFEGSKLDKTLIEQLKQHRGYYLTLAIAAIVFMVMNVLTTLKGDEYVYAMMPGDLRHHCRTLTDYISTMPTFYQTTNGRLADAVERLMASVVGKPVFNVLNTLMFVLMVEGIFTLAVGRRRSLLALSALLVLVLVAFPYPGETLMWMAGACNYLWSVTLTLWLLCWLRYRPVGAGWGSCVAVFGLAFVAGGFNESTSLGCLVGMCIYLLLNRRQATRFRLVALGGYALGVVMVLASPALLMRLEGGNSVNMGLSLLQMVSRRVLSLGFMSLRFLTPLAVLVLLIVQWRRQGWPAIRAHAGYCMLSGVFLIALALGMVIERPYTFMVALSMSIVLHAAYRRLEMWPAMRRTVVTSALLLVAGVGSALVMDKMVIYRNYDRQVHTELQQGPDQCVISARRAPVTSRWIVPDVYDNTQFACAYRSFYAYYYGKENVQFLPDDMLRRYRQGTLLASAVPMQFVSSDPAFSGIVLAVPGQNYGFVQLPPGDPAVNGEGRVYSNDINQIWGEDVARRRYYLGSYRDHMPIRPYALVIGGKNYMVIGCEITDQVTRIEFRRYDIVNRQWRELVLERKKH